MMSEVRNFKRTGDDEVEPLKVDRNTRLAAERTLLAHQRTLMAWIRTSVSLISFGFTIYKFFQYLTQSESVTPAPSLAGPRHFGMGMILVGIVALVLATFDYHRETRVFQAEYGSVPRSSVGKVAVIVSVLGVGLFIALSLNL
jgi:inner membrane protein YidH